MKNWRDNLFAVGSVLAIVGLAASGVFAPVIWKLSWVIAAAFNDAGGKTWDILWPLVGIVRFLWVSLMMFFMAIVGYSFHRAVTKGA